ncbi:MAG TPA: hypothetical protein VJV79_00010 [Polyangiaceae bacterium]|nr:hypothetical protein [Polyangiaceae bacterium]
MARRRPKFSLPDIARAHGISPAAMAAIVREAARKSGSAAFVEIDGHEFFNDGRFWWGHVPPFLIDGGRLRRCVPLKRAAERRSIRPPALRANFSRHAKRTSSGCLVARWRAFEGFKFSDNWRVFEEAPPNG